MFVKKMRQKFQDRLAEAGTLAEENLSSIRTVRSFAGENKASSLYGEEIQKSFEVGKKLAIASGNFHYLLIWTIFELSIVFFANFFFEDGCCYL